MRLTERIKKRRADFWAALGDDGKNGIEELLKLYWWWGSDTADFFFDKFVPDGLSLETLEDEKKNAIGTMLTAVREDIGQLPRTVKAQRHDMDRLAVSVADAAFNARLAERRHHVVRARPVAAFCRSADEEASRPNSTIADDTQNRPKNKPGSTTSELRPKVGDGMKG
jgi:hypothetical protein